MFTLTRCFLWALLHQHKWNSGLLQGRRPGSEFREKSPFQEKKGLQCHLPVFQVQLQPGRFIIAAYSGPFSPYSWRQACSRTYLASRKNWSLYLKVSDFHQFRAAFSEDPCNLPGILLLYLKGFQLKVSKGYLWWIRESLSRNPRKFHIPGLFPLISRQLWFASHWVPELYHIS